MKHEEHQEQVKFVQRVAHLRKDVLCWATPNGGYRRPREAARLKAEGTLSGVPDIFIAKANYDYCGLFLEFKTKRGRVSPQQKVVIDKLISEGYCVKIVRSCEEAWTVLEEYLDG